MKKRGQVTLFIILAIVIVSGILTYFLWAKPTYFSEQGSRVGFEGCIQDAMETKIENLGLTGGFVNPVFNFMHQGQQIGYLCYTNEYYDLCTVQVPFPEAHFSNQLESALRTEVNACYSDSINELRSQGYEVVSGIPDYEVLLEPGFARMEIDAPTVVGSQSFAKFNVKLNNPIYDMLMIATSLLQYESSLGDTDLNALMIYYPEYKVTKNKMGDGTTLYIIESKVYGNKYQFASRSLVFPAGY